MKALKAMTKPISLASDFNLVQEAGYATTKAGIFYAATYGDNKVPVTLLVSNHPTSTKQTTTKHGNDDQAAVPKSNAFSLCPVTKFIDDSISHGLISIVGSKAAAGKIKRFFFFPLYL